MSVTPDQLASLPGWAQKHLKRGDILCRAAYDLLTVADRAGYVMEANVILTRFDEADCDGSCLRDDLACHLGISGDTDPIATVESHNE